MSFLILGEIAAKCPDAWQPAFLPIKVAVPGLLFLMYFRRGEYPELRTYRPGVGLFLVDLAVGVLGAAVWMAPYIVALQYEPPLWNALPELLQPDPSEGFDRSQLGTGLVGLTLAIRALGYAVVTPFAEEAFVRSWLMRFAHVFDKPIDFRTVPVAHFSWRSFWIVVLFFTASHVPWEWPVAVAWIVGTQCWFYYRRELGAMVTVHAGSNAAILLFVWLTDGGITGAGGRVLDLWFFV
jgi:membrane protease YdiL (CAAX protease family)